MATRSISGVQFKASLLGLYRNLLTDGTVAAEASLNCNLLDRFTTGVDAAQADRVWQVNDYVLNVGSSVVLNLYNFSGIDGGGGMGNDPLGQQMSPIDEIVAIVIRNENTSGNLGVLEVEPNTASNPWYGIGSHTVALGNGIGAQGTLARCQPSEAGLPVTDGANQNLKFTAVTNTVTFSVWVLARHDADESSSSYSSSSSSSSSSSTSSSSWSSQSTSSSSSSSSRSSTSSSSLSSSQSTSSQSSPSSSISTSSPSSFSSSSWSSQSSSSSSISTSTSSASQSSASSSSWSSV